MLMMAYGTEMGWSGDETLEKAKKLGFECDKPELEQFVREYVDNHSAT